MNFESLEKICTANSAISSKMLDQFLIPYAATKNKVDRQMDKELLRFRHVTKSFQKSWLGILKAQYIVHRIFQKDGLIHQYLHQSALQSLTKDERDYFQVQADNPWRFGFSVILNEPAHDFFEMQDVFTGEVFLLYSPGTRLTLQKVPFSMWFHLLSFNGACYQSFGLNIGFQSFDMDDVFFFATELNHTITTEEELLADVAKNPVPYMMLLVGSAYPVTMQGGHRLVHVLSEYEYDETFEITDALREHFTIEYSHDTYRLTPKHAEEHRPTSAAYYDEVNDLLVLSALTDADYDELIRLLNLHGLNLPYEAMIRVSPSMLITAEKVISKKIELNEYETRFEKHSSPEEQAQMDKLNKLMQLALPDINSGRQPDISALAKQVGLDEQTAHDVLKQVIGKIDQRRK